MATERENLATFLQPNILGEKKFITSSTSDSSSPDTEIVWEYEKGKGGGANEAGKYGGVYAVYANPKLDLPKAESSPSVSQEQESRKVVKRALFKQDPHAAKNIAEYLASRMHRATHPNHQAEVFFAVAGIKGVDNPYIASVFIENYKGDLYKYAYEHKGLEPPESRPLLTGSKKILATKLNIENTATHIEEILDNSTGFAESVVPRLLTNDMDMHSGNLGIVEENGMKKVVSIDFGGANGALKSKIHPHSHTRHKPGLGPTNHFREYSRKYKITPEFALECDKVAEFDYTQTIDQAFKEIFEYNNLTAIKEFGIRLGVPKNKLEIVNKEELTETIKQYYKETIVTRQADLAKFSAQIKTDLCLKNFKEQGVLEYSSTSKEGSQPQVIALSQVIKDNKKYFQDILDGKEKLKFRDKDNLKNYSELKKIVLDEIEKTLAEERLKEGTTNSLYKKAFIDNKLFEHIKPQSTASKDGSTTSLPTQQILNNNKLNNLTKTISASINLHLPTKKNGEISQPTTYLATTEPIIYQNNIAPKIVGIRNLLERFSRTIKSYIDLAKSKISGEQKER